MEYRVEELAKAAGVRVDTVRFYQGRGLLRKPRREGRIALYGSDHLARLRRIRSLLDQGFKLDQISRVLVAAEAGESPGPLLEALAEDGLGECTLSRAELAAEAGVPESLIEAARAAGLVEPLDVGGQERFTGADLEMARAALAILGAGFPLDSLLALAADHAHHVQSVVDTAIDLFGDHIRKKSIRKKSADEEAIGLAFRRLLPQVTRLVALHFQRTLVSRALERLGDDDGALERTLVALQTESMDLEWH